MFVLGLVSLVPYHAELLAGSIFLTVLPREYSINRIQFWIYSEIGFRFMWFAHIKPFSDSSETDVTVVCLPRMMLFTAKGPFDLPSELETGFIVNLNPDTIIE